MRIKDELYFAPNIKFTEIDMSGSSLPNQFERRIRGYYLGPAVELAQAGHAFASGVLLVACIDALAYHQMVESGMGSRFSNWCKECLPSFNNIQYAKLFYSNFRNGLVHNARIKNGGEFTLELNCTVKQRNQIVSINTLYLAKEISDALRDYVAFLNAEPQERQRFINKIKQDFYYELNN